MVIVFTAFLFAGAASIACWVSVRFPELMPTSMAVRGVGAIASVKVLGFVNTDTNTTLKLYVSVFVLLLPALVVVWLFVLSFMQGLRDALSAMR
jgi:hypothetical protein